MPKLRIDGARALNISKKLSKYKRLRGGRKMVMDGAGITDRIWYAALAGAELEVPNAEKLERFLGIGQKKEA